MVLLYRPINKEGGPKYRFSYVTIKGKSGPVYCTEREQIAFTLSALSLTLVKPEFKHSQKLPLITEVAYIVK